MSQTNIKSTEAWEEYFRRLSTDALLDILSSSQFGDSLAPEEQEQRVLIKNILKSRGVDESQFHEQSSHIITEEDDTSRAKEEWQKHAEAKSTDVLLGILATTKRKKGRMTPGLIEKREAIKNILKGRGLDSTEIAKRSHKIAKQKVAEPYKAPQPDEPRIDYEPYLLISALAVSLIISGCLGWLIYQKAIQYELSDPALRSSFIYGVMFGLVLKFWLSILRDKIEDVTKLTDIKSPYYLPHYEKPGAKDWLLYFLHILLHSVFNAASSILFTICLLLYAFHNLTEEYRALLSVSIFILVFASLKWALNKYAPGERFFDKPSKTFLWVVALISILFSAAIFGCFMGEGWTSAKVLVQISLIAISMALFMVAIKTEQKSNKK